MVDIALLLSKVPYFANLSSDELEKYANSSKVTKLACGETLIQEGELDDRIYIVLDGRLRASSTKIRKGEVVMGEIGKGEVVGETAPLMQVPRVASVKAIRDSLLLEINAEDLLYLIKKDDDTLRIFAKNLLQRSQTSFAYKHETLSLLLFPLHPQLDLKDFVRSLVKELVLFSKAIVVSPKDFEGKIDLSNEDQLAFELIDLETANPLVIYLSSGEWDLWTRVVARRCDRTLLVGAAGQDPGLGQAEKQLWDELTSSNHTRVELTLLHPADTRQPRNTKKWFEHRKIERHFHLAKGKREHFQKLARFLTGNAIGFALSGGGFKAAMQVGVLQALEEAGIPLDILGGSSGGAFASAIFALETDPKEIPELIMQGLAQFRKAGKLTPPMVSLFTGKYLTNGLRHFLGDVAIEDLWKSYFCTSLNLVDGSIKAHQRGPLWEAVRASSSVMALFPPVIREGECLVDGGFVNPCPTDILHQMGVGKIVAISAFESGGVKLDAAFPPETNGWRILMKKINPFDRRKFRPSLASNVVQSMMFASEHLLQETFAHSKIDLLIEPDLSQYSSQDRSSVKTFYEIGYNHVRERATEWKEILLP